MAPLKHRVIASVSILSLNGVDGAVGVDVADVGRRRVGVGQRALIAAVAPRPSSSGWVMWKASLDAP